MLSLAFSLVACQLRENSTIQSTRRTEPAEQRAEDSQDLLRAKHWIVELSHEYSEQRDSAETRLLNAPDGLSIAEKADTTVVDAETRVRLRRIIRTLSTEPRNPRECLRLYADTCTRKDAAAFWNFISVRGKKTWIEDTIGLDFRDLISNDGEAIEWLCQRHFGQDVASLRKMSYEEAAWVLVKRQVEQVGPGLEMPDVELISHRFEADRMFMSVKFSNAEEPVTLEWHAEEGKWRVDLYVSVRWK